MQVYVLILVCGVAAVLCYDMLSVFLVKQLNLNHFLIAVFSLLIYAVIGYFSAKYIHTLAAVSIASMVGLVDTFIGWKFTQNIELLEEEDVADEVNEFSIEIVFVVILTSMGVGFLGALFS